MNVQDFDCALLALEGWREAGDDRLDTMLVIASLISNLSKRDEITIGEAILKHRELHGLPAPEEKFPDPRDPRMAKLLLKIGDLGGPWGEDLTNGAIYMVDVNQPIPDHLAKLLQDPEAHPMVGMHGTRKFFK
jgi:hypothetical protein